MDSLRELHDLLQSDLEVLALPDIDSNLRAIMYYREIWVNFAMNQGGTNHGQCHG